MLIVFLSLVNAENSRSSAMEKQVGTIPRLSNQHLSLAETRAAFKGEKVALEGLEKWTNSASSVNGLVQRKSRV
jgi:hypothetical protein